MHLSQRVERDSTRNTYRLSWAIMSTPKFVRLDSRRAVRPNLIRFGFWFFVLTRNWDELIYHFICTRAPKSNVLYLFRWTSLGEQNLRMYDDLFRLEMRIRIVWIALHVCWCDGFRGNIFCSRAMCEYRGWVIRTSTFSYTCMSSDDC